MTSRVFHGLLLAWGVLGALGAEDNRFTEELLLRPLASGHIHSHFEFTTTWYSPEVSEAIQHYRDFGEHGRGGGGALGRHTP